MDRSEPAGRQVIGIVTPFDTQSQSLSNTIWHFSGAGAVQGTASEIQSRFQRVSSNPEDAMTQRMAEYLIGERQHQFRGEPGDREFASKMIAYQRDYYQQFIQPQRALIRQDCEAAKRVLPQALGWERMVQLLGTTDQFNSEHEQIWQAFGDALVNCYDKEYDQCVLDGDINHRQTMLAYYRQASLLSPSEGGGIVSRLDYSKILKCPRRSYEAVSSSYGAQVSGIVCALEKPFKINWAAPASTVSLVYVFTPSSLTGGTIQFQGGWTRGGGSMQGHPRGYTVGGTEDEPTLDIEGGTNSDVDFNNGGFVWNDPAEDILLKPLDKPCDQ